MVMTAEQSRRQRRHYLSLLHAFERRLWRGSVRGRRGNRGRDFNVDLQSLKRDYVGLGGHPPEFGKAEFERRFRVPRSVFIKIYNDVEDLPYWKRKPNATGRPQIHPQ